MLKIKNIINKIKILSYRLKLFFIGLNYFNISVFILFPIIIWLIFIFPSNYIKEIDIKIKDDQFPYQEKIYIDDSFKKENILSKILNTTFSLDTYKICIDNKSYILQNLTEISNNELSKSIGEMVVDIYPFKTNQIVMSHYEFFKEKNSSFAQFLEKENVKKERVYQHKLRAKQGDVECIRIQKNEDGFFYGIPYISGFSSISIPKQEGKDPLDEFSITQGEDTFTAKYNNSRFFLKTDFSALFAKLFIFFISWAGFLLLIFEIIKKLGLKNKNNF